MAYNPEHRFTLEYVGRDGKLRQEVGCILVHWNDDDSFSVLDSADKPLSNDDDEWYAVESARWYLADRGWHRAVRS